MALPNKSACCNTSTLWTNWTEFECLTDKIYKDWLDHWYLVQDSQGPCWGVGGGGGGGGGEGFGAEFLPEASFGLRALSLPASFCPSVRLYVCLSESLACPRANSGAVQARITKFGPKMQKTLVRVPIALWTDWPWPSRSNLTWKFQIYPIYILSTP